MPTVIDSMKGYADEEIRCVDDVDGVDFVSSKTPFDDMDEIAGLTFVSSAVPSLVGLVQVEAVDSVSDFDSGSGSGSGSGSDSEDSVVVVSASPVQVVSSNAGRVESKITSTVDAKAIEKIAYMLSQSEGNLSFISKFMSENKMLIEGLGHETIAALSKKSSQFDHVWKNALSLFKGLLNSAQDCSEPAVSKMVSQPKKRQLTQIKKRVKSKYRTKHSDPISAVNHFFESGCSVEFPEVTTAVKKCYEAMISQVTVCVSPEKGGVCYSKLSGVDPKILKENLLNCVSEIFNIEAPTFKTDDVSKQKVCLKKCGYTKCQIDAILGSAEFDLPSFAGEPLALSPDVYMHVLAMLELFNDQPHASAISGNDSNQRLVTQLRKVVLYKPLYDAVLGHHSQDYLLKQSGKLADAYIKAYACLVLDVISDVRSDIAGRFLHKHDVASEAGRAAYMQSFARYLSRSDIPSITKLKKMWESAREQMSLDAVHQGATMVIPKWTELMCGQSGFLSKKRKPSSSKKSGGEVSSGNKRGRGTQKDRPKPKKRQKVDESGLAGLFRGALALYRISSFRKTVSSEDRRKFDNLASACVSVRSAESDEDEVVEVTHDANQSDGGSLLQLAVPSSDLVALGSSGHLGLFGTQSGGAATGGYDDNDLGGESSESIGAESLDSLLGDLLAAHEEMYPQMFGPVQGK